MDIGDERTVSDSKQGHPSGWIYILENQGMPDLFKIGMTVHNPHLRAGELSRETGVPSPFFVRKAYFVKDRCKAEKLIHKELDSYRYNENREFFQNYGEHNTGWTKFQDIIEKLLSENYLLDECTSADRMNFQEMTIEEGEKIQGDLKRELKEAYEEISRLKKELKKANAPS